MINGSPDEIDAQDARDHIVIRAIRHLPEAVPPAGLVEGVLQRLQPVRLPWWHRAWRWARKPLSLDLTPLRLASVGLVLVLLWVAVAQKEPPVASRVDSLQAAAATVVFRLPDPAGQIRSAAVIGSFNNWNPKGFQMHFAPDRGVWLLQTQLPPGHHEYAFLVDETRVSPDPQAILTREDGFGNLNSILLLTEGDEQKI